MCIRDSAEVDVAVDDVQRFLWLRLKLHVRRVVEAARTLGEVRRADSFLRLRHLNLIAVSYTHLDVYKRQVYATMKCTRN